ncbi:hypothetical protein M9458_030516, partial [Cirrhinus mrigala]
WMTGSQLVIVVTRAQKKKSLNRIRPAEQRWPPRRKKRASFKQRMVKVERVQLVLNAPLEEGGEAEEVEVEAEAEAEAEAELEVEAEEVEECKEDQDWTENQ